MVALAHNSSMLVRRIFVDLISDFEQEGVRECANEDYRQLEG